MGDERSIRERWEELAMHRPLSSVRLDEIFTATVRYGSGNGYAGTSGMLAGMLRELLAERARLLSERTERT